MYIFSIIQILKERGVNNKMMLSELMNLLKCQLISPDDIIPEIDVQFAYASDLMSDILVAAKPGALLITGLTNNQVIRTGKVAVSCAIVFVRGKKPTPETIELAKQYNIPILATTLSMFDVCGILFINGVKGVSSEN